MAHDRRRRSHRLFDVSTTVTELIHAPFEVGACCHGNSPFVRTAGVSVNRSAVATKPLAGTEIPCHK